MSIRYIQKKIDGKWLTVLPVSEEGAHRACNHLTKHNPGAEFRISSKERTGNIQS